MKNNLIKILKDEVKPAMGCTEPVAVTLAAAKAREIGNYKTIDKVIVKVSPNIFKNGLSVGIPKIDLVGILPAAAVGCITGDSDYGLKIYESVKTEKTNEVKALIHENNLEIQIADTEEKVYIEVQIFSDQSHTKVIIQGMHNHFSFISKDKIILLDHPFNKEEKGLDITQYKIAEIINEVIKSNAKEFDFLLEGLEMNGKMMKLGLKQKLGLGIGYNTKRAIDDGVLGDDLANRAMYYTASASDARMSGVALPVMSSNGSGNNGLTAILPLLAYRDLNKTDNDSMSKALAISHLINCYIKSGIGRLSALCSCGISAATGASAAIAWLEGGSIEVIEGTIQNMIANLSGMICDGAKNSCALKLATAASTGIHTAVWAKYGSISDHHEGIVGKTAEDSIKNLGVLSRKGMQLTDQTILKIMREM